MSTGLIAIIRGVTPDDAVDIAGAIHRSGIHLIEVPLNSPDPFTSIRLIREALPGDCRVGAGTVLSVEDVRRAHEAGAELIVSPNTDVDVIAETVRLGMASYPGVATPTEAFRALAAGATGIKLFPGSAVGIPGMKAWRAVLPAGTQVLPVGGVDDTNLDQWLHAGADGAGIGGSLYRAGDSAGDVEHRARALTEIWAQEHPATAAGAADAPDAAATTAGAMDAAVTTTTESTEGAQA